MPGIWLERYYHHLFKSDKNAIRVIAEMGLGPRLARHRPVTTVQVDGVPYQLDSPGSLLRFPPLSIVARLRMAAVTRAARGRCRPRARLERVEADRWMALACGASGHGCVWRPLLQAKFGSAVPPGVDGMAVGAPPRPDVGARLPPASGFHQLYEALAAGDGLAGGAIDLDCDVRSIRR